MKFFPLFLFVLVILLQSSVYGENNYIKLNGYLNIYQGKTYKYTLEIFNKDSSWSGFSILDEGGPNETKSTIAVRFNKEAGTFNFTEKKLIYSKANSKEFCFIGAVLRPSGKKLKGFFVGKDQENKLCGGGTVKFDIPENVPELFTKPAEQPLDNDKIISAYNTEHLKVKQTQIELQIWDAGANDHDTVVLMLNGAPVLERYEVITDKKMILLNLREGKNELILKAINEGDIKPNTARILVTDHKNNNYTLLSFLQVGEEARIEVTAQK